MWFPIDLPVASEYFVQRAPTAQATTPQSKTFMFPLAWRTLEGKSSQQISPAGAQNTNSVTQAHLSQRTIGLAMSPSSGLWFAALLSEDFLNMRNVPEIGQWRVSGVSEEFFVREGLARVGFDVTSNCNLAFGVRSQVVRGDVLGSFSSAVDERVIYTGQRMGVIVGSVFTLAPLKFSLRYETPVTGKIEASGESKVTSTQGFTGAAVQFQLNGESALMVEYGMYSPSKNELAVPLDTTIKNRRLSVSLLGLAVDARALPLNVLGMGYSTRIAQAAKLETDVALGQIYFTSDPEMLVPNSIGDSEKLKMSKARIGVAIEKGDWESQLFADYSTFKGSRTQGQNQIANTTSQWGIGLRAGIEL